MGKLMDISSENYDSVMSEEGLLLIDFWAPWCGPCRMQTPILEKIAASEDIDATIAKLNTDDNPDIAQKLDIVSIPTLILFKDGQEIERFIGVQPEDILIDKLKQ